MQQRTNDSAPRLSPTALALLEKRFLLRDSHGELTEDVDHMFRRVASAIATADTKYGDHSSQESAEIFYELMSSLRWLPNSPTLMNAGTPDGQLSGCFVLPIDDSMESIYGTLRDAALIQKSGGGTGFSFSRLRPKGDYIHSSRGSSSGPVSFIKLYDFSTLINRMGGTRAGANMAVLRHDHPDIFQFAEAKADPGAITTFNLSVMVTREFMDQVATNRNFELTFPGGADSVSRGTKSAKSLFETIVNSAWMTGDPGLLFFDRINSANPTPGLGFIESVNPCGEQPLLPYESCNLGSIDVSKYVRNGGIDYPALRETIRCAVHFLDNVLDLNCHSVEAVRAATLRTRKIGLGIMGFADLLISLRTPYASRSALSTAEDLMAFVQQEALLASQELAASRGPFPAFWQSRFSDNRGPLVRNATQTSIAPTGTISLLAGCSSGIEPLFALSYRREMLGSTQTFDVHPALAPVLAQLNIDVAAELRRVRDIGRLGSPEVPGGVKEVFLTAHEIEPDWHVQMQAAFQKHTDTGVSKTVNLRKEAPPSDVAKAYWLAFELGCKGVTVFRDGCKTEQVLSAGSLNSKCPDCDSDLIPQAGCWNCPSCGYSMCSI